MRRSLIAPALLLLVLAAAGPVRAEAQKDTLHILLDGHPIGTETYEINSTGTEISAKGEVELKVGDIEVRQQVSLLLNADLSPRSYEWKLKQPRESWVRMEWKGTQATIAFPREDGKQEEQIYDFQGKKVAVLDVNVFHHFLLLTRLYDFEKGGVQTIPVFIPQAVQPGEVTMELEGVDQLAVDGQEQPVRRLSIATEDNSLRLWVTENGRFVKLEVPQANVEVVPAGAQP